MANTTKKKPAGRPIAKNHNKSTKPKQKQALAQEPSVGQARTGHGGDPDRPICTCQQNAEAKGERILPRTGPGHMAADGCYGSNCGKELEWGPFPQQSKKSSLLSSCDDPPLHACPKGGGWAHNTLMALPEDPSDHYVEVLGPLWEEEVDEETLMTFKQFLEESYVTGQEESIPTIDDDATDNSVVLTNKGGSATTSEEKDYTEIESLYACSSPLASYFEEQAFSWNQAGGAFGEIGSGIWSEEEEDIRIWS